MIMKGISSQKYLKICLFNGFDEQEEKCLVIRNGSL